EIIVLGIAALVIYALLSVLCRVYRRQWIRRHENSAASGEVLEKIRQALVERVFTPMQRSFRKTADRAPSESESS
ncbi:MAG: hypothetical protein ACSHXD_20370, partial [Marinosulfonomonas sp.]